MKGRTGRKSGGGVDSAAADLKSNPPRRDDADKIENEASQKKSGGKVGGSSKSCAGRAARKSGGRATVANPFSSAHSGSQAKGRSVKLR